MSDFDINNEAEVMTVDELREALSHVDGNVEITDAMGDHLLLTFWHDVDTGKKTIVFS